MSASVPSTKLRLDKSRYHSTIHGERRPDDPHVRAVYLQDGIHFDAHGFHIDELITDEKTRALVDRRLKRQTKAAPKQEGDDPVDAGDGEDEEAGSPPGGPESSEDVNLEAWLRGEAKYPWFGITKLVRERYHQNLSKMVDVLEFLVFDEKVVREDELSPELKKQLRPSQG